MKDQFSRRCFSMAATRVVLWLLLVAMNTRFGWAQTSVPKAVVACTDVGVQLRIRRSSAMPLVELSELHTGRSCATTTLMTTIADVANSELDQAALDVVDCVTTRIDEDFVGLFSVMRVCNRPLGVDAMPLATWDEHIRPKLLHVFGPRSTRGGGLQYHGSTVEFDQLAIPTSYNCRLSASGTDKNEDTPRFRYKSTELWSVRGSSSPESSLVLLKLKVKNDGSAPLHVFAAAVKLVDDVPSNGVLVLTLHNVEAIMPSTERTVTFQLVVPNVVEFPQEADFQVYFAHTSSRAHILEGRLDGKKLKITDGVKKMRSPAKAQADLLSVHKIDGSNALEATYTSFGLRLWQLISIGIVVTVGMVTTVYMRRKWTRVQWPSWNDCLTAKKLKHKSSSLSKMTEMTSKQPAYEPDAGSDADMDALESDGFLPNSSVEAILPPRKKPMTKLREKMPAITMQWKKPEILRSKLSGRRILALDSSARLDPKRFELLWEEFIQRHTSSVQATKRPTAHMVVQAMAAVGVMCMASGTVNCVEKYVLYAKQRDSTDFFFATVDITMPSSEAGLIVRSSKDTNESLVEQFVALMHKQLAVIFT